MADRSAAAALRTWSKGCLILRLGVASDMLYSFLIDVSADSVLQLLLQFVHLARLQVLAKHLSLAVATAYPVVTRPRCPACTCSLTQRSLAGAA